MESKRKCFEAQFNGKPKNICRTLAYTKEQAIEKFKECYPNDVVTKIYEP